MWWPSFRTTTALHIVLKRVILCGLTPAEAQKPLANESWPHFANDRQVGLPRLSQHPAEGRQEEEMQEGSSHSTEALLNKESYRERQGITTHGEVLFQQTNKKFLRGDVTNHLLGLGRGIWNLCKIERTKAKILSGRTRVQPGTAVCGTRLIDTDHHTVQPCLVRGLRMPALRTPLYELCLLLNPGGFWQFCF